LDTVDMTEEEVSNVVEQICGSVLGQGGFSARLVDAVERAATGFVNSGGATATKMELQIVLEKGDCAPGALMGVRAGVRFTVSAMEPERN